MAYVLKAMDQNSSVEEGKWVDGPDGRRDMDVVLKGSVDGKKFSLLVECKDYDVKTTGKVGIGIVDAIDSKKYDLSVNAAMICSNSGFTSGAIRKAKRKGIGLVSVLKSGDPMIKVEVLEEIYTRKVKIKTITVDFGTEIPKEIPLSDITFEGKPLLNWANHKVMMIFGMNYFGSGKIRAEHNLKVPIQLLFRNLEITVAKIDITFDQNTEWFSHIVSVDASLGMYDYLRGRVRLGPGETNYIIKGVDIHGGKPINFIPNRDDFYLGLLPGEFQIDLMLYDGLDLPANSSETPNIDAFIVEEDLDLKISE